MSKKSYKQKYEELKSKIDVKKEIETHTKHYIPIPFSWKAIGMFFAFIASVGLAIANWFLMLSIWKLSELGDLTKETIKGFHQLLILYPILGEYLLINLSIISLVAMIKGGYDKLKPIDEEGLIVGLIFGLIVGLIFGLISGLIFGLIVGLIVGLIGGLIVGLENEFR